METPKIIKNLDLHLQDKLPLPTAPQLDADAINFDTEWLRGVGSDHACSVTLTAKLAVKTVVFGNQTLRDLGSFATIGEPLRRGILHSIYGDVVEELLRLRRLAYNMGLICQDQELFKRITEMISVLQGEG